MRALDALLETPQNNMRIFKDARLLYGGDGEDAGAGADIDALLSPHLNVLFGNDGVNSGSNAAAAAADFDRRNRSKFIALIAGALLAEFRDDRRATVSVVPRQFAATMVVDGKCDDANDADVVHLPVGCVLRRVLNVQQLLAVSFDSPTAATYKRSQISRVSHTTNRQPCDTFQSTAANTRWTTTTTTMRPTIVASTASSPSYATAKRRRTTTSAPTSAICSAQVRSTAPS